MPSISLERVLHQLLTAEGYQERHPIKEHAAPRHPLVALSYDYGVEGAVIGQALARQLEVHYIGCEDTESDVNSLNLEEILLHRLEQEAPRHHHTLMEFLSGSPGTMPTYRRQLVDALLMIAEREGGVITGRGAHILLRNHEIFRIRLIGSPESCAQRVAERESLSLEEARDVVEKRNQEKARYLHALLGKKNVFDPLLFDLTINTDRMPQNTEGIAQVLVQMMQAMGLPVHKDGEKA